MPVSKSRSVQAYCWATPAALAFMGFLDQASCYLSQLLTSILVIIMQSSSFFAIAALGGCLSEFKERNFAPEMTVLSPLEGEVYNVGNSIFFDSF